MKKLTSQQSGFTLVELLLALAFFSFVLLFAVAGFVQINRSYNKGLTVKQIHETGRLVIEDIARSIRISDRVEFIDDAQNRRLCTENTRFGWNELADSGGDLERFQSSGWYLNFARTTNSGSCAAGIPTSAESYFDRGADVFSPPNRVYGGIVVVDFDVTVVGQAVRIELELASSDPENDLLDRSDPNNVSCRGSLVVGDQFCDTVELSTTVTLRGT